jgi:hypothetical protein
MPKSYRIRTQVGIDKAIKVNLQQDFESINILSLKILQSDVYNRQCSDYGVIVGRVFVNGGFGLPNARVSIFIPLSDEDALNPVISELYPYQSISDISADGYRYNLLPKEPSYEGHVATGTFPTKEEALLDQSYIEVYDKYYKYTTRTNESGDYMIFGVPLGTQTVFMDCDLSDVGCFSFGPQDLIQAGAATENQVDGNKFKSSTNLSELPQIKTLNKIIEIAPLWGEPEICQLGITRADFDLTSEANIRIEPKATFMGSVISTTEDDAQKISCKPRNNTGNLCELVAGPGQILAIRQTIKNDEAGLPILEEYKLEQGGKVIDGDGVYLVNVPMNLDYVYTNEFGEQAISTDPTLGVPTKGKYRFKFKWDNEGGLQNEIQRANYFVPNIKEHGWDTSDYDDDPLKNGNSINTTFTIPAGGTSTTLNFLVGGGLVYNSIINGDSFSVSINGNPYFGNTEVIPINAGDQVEITPSIDDITQQSEVTFRFYTQDYFDLLRSYSFSLDWDDYVDPASAINCEDTFYEFHYNKVYTTAMFLDRYKKGIGRARHLGIKEIDDRACKSTVNTFPVNDIIRNFDFIFFIFNLLINILAIPILVILFIAHLIALLWPILKFILIALALYFVVQAAYAVYENIIQITAIINEITGIFSFGAGAVFNLTNVLEAVRLALQAIVLIVKTIFIVGISLAFLALAIFAALKIKDFPRIGLPMISYPDCSSCDCSCGNAEMSDDFDSDSINNIINEAGSENFDAGQASEYVPATASTQNSIFAPINNLGQYTLNHPNLDQPLSTDPPGPGGGDEPLRCLGNFWFQGTLNDCGGGLPDLNSPEFQYRSFQNQASNQALNGVIGVPASLGFIRIAAGSESLDNQNLQLGIPSKYFLHAPQPFLFATYRRFKDVNDSFRYLAQPVTEAYSQKLNEFNYRQKYFDNVNKIGVTFNSPDNVTQHFDQPLVILAKPGTTQNLGIGSLITFQDTTLSNCNINITGATFLSGNTNQFGTNSVTGTTTTGTAINIVVEYANNPNNNLPVSYSLRYTGDTETFLKYPIDVEYYQVITGLTYSKFISNSDVTSTSDKFPSKYLNHGTYYYYVNGNGIESNGAIPQPVSSLDGSGFLTVKGIGVTAHTVTTNTYNLAKTINYLQDYENYEVIILTRGVDPHSPKQRNKYDLSIIFGQSTTNGSVVVEGDYYLNVPIKGVGVKPVSHYTGNETNITNGNLYFETYNFRVGETNNGLNEFQTFNSTLPFYYSNIDESIANTYIPSPTFQPTSLLGNQTTGLINGGSRDKVLPNTELNSGTIGIGYSNMTTNYYYAGGSFTASFLDNSQSLMFGNLGNDSERENDYWAQSENGFRNYAVYSPAYHRYSTSTYNPIQFSVDQTLGSTQYLVMRSDRIPTSTCVEVGQPFPSGTNYTSFGLHQNNKFCVFSVDNAGSPVVSFEPDINAGQGQYDESENVQSLTSTLTCEGMVSLQCYTGTGTNVGVSSNCVVPEGRVKQGCYCLLNPKELNEDDDPILFKLFKKVYLIKDAYKDDAKLFLEWKTRFTVTFAACRGVFAQVFQNNWINGTLYMFSFNKSTTFEIDEPEQPIYNYCKDTVVFNEITKGFYYRSSPWNGSNFIGVDSPPQTGVPAFLRDEYPGFGYNTQRIQFPTTIMDMGPREEFIAKVCNDNDFEGYIVDQMRSTSYKDNSDIIQMGFISRFLNENFRQRILPISVGGDNSEGKGIIQFFNSNRDGERIDGDFAQALSINSEWNVTPYIEENYPNNYLFFGEDGTDGRSVFGVFFKSTEDEYRYRRRLSPGIETYSSSCGLPVLNYYGFPTDQIVPHYKWQIAGPSLNIFGSEDNNWVTTANQNSSGTGFYSQSYQDLDFENVNEYYNSVNAKYGFITNFDGSGNPEDTIAGVQNGTPNGNPVVVGAPFFFYFGLNNGKTAMDKFSKLYLETE